MGRVLSTMTAAGRIATPFSSSREDREESGWFGGRMERIRCGPCATQTLANGYQPNILLSLFCSYGVQRVLVCGFQEIAARVFSFPAETKVLHVRICNFYLSINSYRDLKLSIGVYAGKWFAMFVCFKMTRLIILSNVNYFLLQAFLPI